MLKFIKRRFFQLTDFSWQMNRSCSIIFFFFREIFVFVPICRYKRFSFQLSQYSVFQLWRVGGHVEIDQIIAKTLLPLDNSFFWSYAQCTKLSMAVNVTSFFVPYSRHYDSPSVNWWEDSKAFDAKNLQEYKNIKTHTSWHPNSSSEFVF